MRKLWLIKCGCGHGYYKEVNESWLEKVKTKLFKKHTAICPVCGERNPKTIKIIKKRERK